MAEPPLVSVLIPLYNVERYLDDCVRSVVAQTHRDLEIVLVDDGSTDRSGAICDAWAARDARVRVVHTANRGVAAARNRGLDEARGDVVCFVDSDDWIERDLVERVVRIMERRHADMVVFTYHSASDDGSRTRVSDDAAKFPSPGARDSAQALELLWTERVQNFLWSFAARRALYEGVRFEEGYVMEDMGVTYRLFDAARSIYFLPEPLYHYRVRAESILGEKSATMPRCTVRAIPRIDRFARERYPQLLAVELNWSIRYLTGAIIWAYQGRRHFSRDEYRRFMRSTKRLVWRRVRALGPRRMTRVNLVKCAAVFLHALAPLEYVSRRRSERRA